MSVVLAALYARYCRRQPPFGAFKVGARIKRKNTMRSNKFQTNSDGELYSDVSMVTSKAKSRCKKDTSINSLTPDEIKSEQEAQKQAYIKHFKFSIYGARQRRRGRKPQFTVDVFQLRDFLTNPAWAAYKEHVSPTRFYPEQPKKYVLKEQTDAAREAYNNGDKETYQKLKGELPIIINSSNGHGSKKEFLTGKAKNNNCINYDIDLTKDGKVLMTREEARHRIKNCPHLLYAFPSASNNGFGICINVERLPNTDEGRDLIFHQINQLFFRGILDQGRKDITGCRFLAHCSPEEFYINYDVIPFVGEGILFKSDEQIYHEHVYSGSFMEQFDKWDSEQKAVKVCHWTPSGIYGQTSAAQKNEIDLPVYGFQSEPYGKYMLTKTAMFSQKSLKKAKAQTSFTPPIQVDLCGVNSMQCLNLNGMPANPSKKAKLYQKNPQDVKVGERNNYLTSLQGFLSFRGYSGKTLRKMIMDANELIPVPLDHDEVNKITYYSNKNQFFAGLQSSDSTSQSSTDTNSLTYFQEHEDETYIDSIFTKTSESIGSTFFNRTYTVDTQLRMDRLFTWHQIFKKRFKIIKTGNKSKCLTTKEITLKYIQMFPEWNCMFKSRHARKCSSTGIVA